MQKDYLIVIDKEKVDMELLRTADSSLPRVIRSLQTSTPFVGLRDGAPISVCLVEAKQGYDEIVNLAVVAEEQHKGYGRELLLYVLDYLRDKGTRYVDIGCGNADMRTIAMYQKAGFRIMGVWPDYYIDDNQVAQVINSILNRDMVRFRADLNEKRLTTIGYDASGRK